MTAVRRPVIRAQPNWLLMGGGTIGLAVLLVAGLDEDGPVLCPSRALTGGYCPGCGMTRAAGRAVRGDWVGAWRLHPLIFLVLAQVGLALLAVAHGARWTAPLRRHLPSILFANVGLLLGVWAARVAQGQIPGPW